MSLETYKAIDKVVLEDLVTHQPGLIEKMREAHNSHVTRDVPEGEKVGKGYGTAMYDAARAYMGEHFFEEVSIVDNIYAAADRDQRIEGLVQSWFGGDLRQIEQKYANMSEVPEKARDELIKKAAEGIHQFCFITSFRVVDMLPDDTYETIASYLTVQSDDKGLHDIIQNEHVDSPEKTKKAYKTALQIWYEHENLRRSFAASLDRTEE